MLIGSGRDFWRWLIAAGLTALAAMQPTAVHAQGAPGFGILGDSASDEYRADDNRGGAYSATTLNWMELLVKHRGLNFGPWGTWSAPRRSGYAYNWARSGATSREIISGGQAAGLAAQVAAGKVSIVVVYAGANDFAIWNGTYAEVYNGSVSGSA
jgi:lysophospholipase L1-like esterase